MHKKEFKIHGSVPSHITTSAKGETEAFPFNPHTPTEKQTL
jgi:hypothetical protein